MIERHGLGFPSADWRTPAPELRREALPAAHAEFRIGAGAASLAFGRLGLVMRHVSALRWLAPTGQMALGRYLLQSLLWTTLIHGYGFGLGEQLSRALQLPLSLLCFVAQIVLSRWWMVRFRYGPAAPLSP